MTKCILPFPHHRISILLLTAGSLFLLSFATLPSFAVPPEAMNGTSLTAYFVFPASSTAALVSFDWDSDGVLHYTVGDPNWGLKLEVYKGSSPLPVFISNAVWAGSRITRIGDKMYFNDGGDFFRFDFNYYFYDAASPGSVASFLEVPYGASLWGLETDGSGRFFASGSQATWGPGALFFSEVDSSGNLVSVPPLLLGTMGDVPGPLTFDTIGNLFYAPGYVFVGNASVYRWTAAEVAEAVMGTTMLAPAGHAWATVPSPYSGATGLAVDGYGNVYASATAWGSPSQLLLFDANTHDCLPIAQYGGRLETVRVNDGAIYVSCAEGIFQFTAPVLAVAALDDTAVTVSTDSTALFSVKAVGGTGTKNYQWYKVSSDKSAIPVGGNFPHYSFQASYSDNGTSYYCVVSDGLSSVPSPTFVLTVLPPVPVNSMVVALGVGILCVVALLIRVHPITSPKHGGSIACKKNVI